MFARGRGMTISNFNVNKCPNGSGIHLNGSERQSVNIIGRGKIQAVEHMELEEALVVIPINPKNFPAKLWRLVNNPNNRSIRWDANGEGVIIDQQMFQSELLSPVKPTADSSDVFKTTNFSSFIRQLNLYGFRKVVLNPGSSEKFEDGDLIRTEGVQHYFHNPNFKKIQPELLVNLKRLTTSNKAKLEAGLDVDCIPPDRSRKLLSNSSDVEDTGKHGSVFVGEVHRGFSRNNTSPYQYHQTRMHSMNNYDRTPFPQCSWIMRHSDSSSPTIFSDKGIPRSVIQHFSTDASYPMKSSPTTWHFQQGSQAMSVAGQTYNPFMLHHTEYCPGLYAPGSWNNDMTGCAHPTPSLYSPYSYYQSTYPVGFLHHGYQDWQSNETEESKKNCVNLDTAFQTVDELQESPKLHIVKVETPENQLQTNPASEQHSADPSSNPPASTQLNSQDSVYSSLLPVVIDSTKGSTSVPVSVDDKIFAMPGTDRPSTATAVLNCCEKTPQAKPSETNDHLNDVLTSPSPSKEIKKSRQHIKTPDLNLLVEVACKQES